MEKAGREKAKHAFLTHSGTLLHMPYREMRYIVAPEVRASRHYPADGGAAVIEAGDALRAALVRPKVR